MLGLAQVLESLKEERRFNMSWVWQLPQEWHMLAKDSKNLEKKIWRELETLHAHLLLPELHTLVLDSEK